MMALETSASVGTTKLPLPSEDLEVELLSKVAAISTISISHLNVTRGPTLSPSLSASRKRGPSVKAVVRFYSPGELVVKFFPQGMTQQVI